MNARERENEKTKSVRVKAKKCIMCTVRPIRCSFWSLRSNAFVFRTVGKEMEINVLSSPSIENDRRKMKNIQSLSTLLGSITTHIYIIHMTGALRPIWMTLTMTTPTDANRCQWRWVRPRQRQNVGYGPYDECTIRTRSDTQKQEATEMKEGRTRKKKPPPTITL